MLLLPQDSLLGIILGTIIYNNYFFLYVVHQTYLRNFIQNAVYRFTFVISRDDNRQC